jgi:dolichol-phosphate mannosyltransferase
MANEAATVEAFLEQVLVQLDDGDRIFCVVDHASVDNTADLVRSCALRDGRVNLVWAPENQCVVDAYFRGYREALAADCRWILEMDGGFSHAPAYIPEFLKAMQEGYDFAAGSRFCKGGRYQGRLSRWLLSWGGSLMANMMLGSRMSDMTSGFECFTHEALHYVVEQGVESRGHFFQTEIRFMLSPWRWTQIPIHYAAPSSGVDSGTVFESLKNLWQLRRKRRAVLERSKQVAQSSRRHHDDSAFDA